MRIAVLWSCLSGYLNACLKELASRDGVQLFVCDQPLAPPQAPFDDSQFAWIQDRFRFRSADDADLLAEKVRAFDPEILVFSSWNIPAYRRISRMLAKKAFRVLAMDNAWRATPKQRVGALIAPWYVQPLADAIWLPGEPQVAFAKRLGFEQRNILRGIYSCDQPTIEQVHVKRVNAGRPVPRAFLFVGRFVECKGLDQLTKAYESYRSRARNPWPLICCGTGPLESQLKGRLGIHLEGFIQPEHLTEKLASAGCLILPSTLENWSIALHEAASAGLLILASENVGATAHLVQSNYNGFIFKNRDVEGMSALMSYVSDLSDDRLDAMSRASHQLSKQFTPARWADTILESRSLAMSSS